MRGDGIAAMIFDYGGVLARTVDPEPRATWERGLGLAPGALTTAVHDQQLWVAAQNGSIHADAHWQAVGEALRLREAQLRGLRASFYGGDELDRQLLARIDRLRQQDVTLGLLSNFSTDLRGMLAAQDLLRRFDHVAISAEIGAMKPDAAAYEAILEMLALPASACAFVDDLPANVAAAQALGMHGIVFEDTASCMQALEGLLRGRPQGIRSSAVTCPPSRSPTRRQ
jgi:putative hydrolase of the HAD superfamily